MPGFQIPILDSSLRIVGWTSEAPMIHATALHHPEAESLIGGPIEAVYVELNDIEEKASAGAPEDWQGPWRCLAIADQEAARIILRRKEA